MDRRVGLARDGSTEGARRRSTAGAYAQLVRLPNLFTAPPDVLLGAALVSLDATGVDPVAAGGLALASMTLYAGGTTLNDAFDAPADGRDRPDRPIPSGRIARSTAFVLGFVLLGAGVLVAFLAADWPGAAVAGSIAMAIVIYDGAVKGTPAGFVTMGAIRGLNVVLGLSVVALPFAGRRVGTIAVPAIIAIYIAAVTYMADRETAGGNPGAVAIAGGASIVAVLWLGVHLLHVRPPVANVLVALGFAGGFLWWVGRPLRLAYRDPTPGTIGPAVGMCVLGLVLLDAVYAAASGIGWAIASAAFLVPAWTLSRWFAVT